MRVNHEEILARNPVLLARCFWHFSKHYAAVAGGGAPSLPLFLVAAAILFHEASVEKIYRMNLDSGFLKVVMERPDLLAGIQRRLEASLDSALCAIQLAVSSKLLRREQSEGFPLFFAVGDNIPVALRDAPYQGQAINAAKRLGAWLAAEPLPVIRRQLMLEF